jgi:two-component system sensor kinase FixL
LPRFVHIVDDDIQVRAATSYLLSSHAYSTEIYSGGRELLREAKLARGCILLDLRMPDMSGHEVQEELARRGVDLPVVVMSAHGDLGSAVKAMKLGAVDFIEKPPREDELLAAIDRAIHAFEQGRDRREAKSRAVAKLDKLSPRERQILQGLLAGLSNKVMARRLDLSPRTIEMHRANMMDDLGVSSLPEAVRLAIDGGLPPLGEEEAAPAAGGPPPVRATVDRDAERLRLALEASGDGAWDYNIATGNVVMSPRFLERLGYEPSAIRGRLESFRQLVHPDDIGRVDQAIKRHLAGETETYSCEYRVRTASGGWCWNFDRGRVVDTDPATGAPLRMVGSASDVTEMKRREEEAREQAELLSLAQRGAGVGLWALELATGRLRLCARSREMHGLPVDGPETITEAEWMAQLHPDDSRPARAALQEALRTDATSVAEFRTVAADGTVRWVRGIGKLVHDDAGRAVQMVGLNQDITDSKQAAFEMKRLQKEQIRFSEVSAVGTMASTLAHELNQPLTAIANFVRGIRRGLAETPLIEDAKLQEALTGTERSADLASEILSRIRNQVAFDEPDRRPSSLAACIRESICLALFDAEERGVRYMLDFDEAADEVNVDSVQIQQLMLNLLRNAVEALAEVPRPQRRMTISARGTEEGVEVRVTDTGPGIAPELRDALFDPFTTTRPEGTGLGLSISRAIVDAHGGRIWAEHPPSGGAALCFTLAR